MQFKSSCGGSWKSSKDSVQLELTYERNFALHIDLTHNEGIQALTSDTTVPNDLKNLAVQVNVLKFELQALNYFRKSCNIDLSIQVEISDHFKSRPTSFSLDSMFSKDGRS
jgi:hypothetical protein